MSHWEQIGVENLAAQARGPAPWWRRLAVGAAIITGSAIMWFALLWPWLRHF